MKIDTFVKLFNVKNTDEEKQKAIEDVINNNHVSFSDKVDRVGLIAKKSYHTKKKDLDGQEHEVFEQNSAAKYMLYSLTLVDLYTRLEIDYKKSLEHFEMINGEILDRIILSIDDREKKEFQMLLDFACDDLLVNEYESHAFIREQVDRFANLFSSILLPVIESIDINKIQDAIKDIGMIKE